MPTAFGMLVDNRMPRPQKRDMVMPSLGPFEIAIILVMVLILFGPGKLPQVFGALGDGMRQFKKASQGLTDEVNQTLSTHNPAETPSAPANSTPQGTTAPAAPVENGTSSPSPTSVS